MSANSPPEGVVPFRIDGVQAYPHITDFGFGQQPGHLGGDQSSIGGYNRPQAHLPGMKSQGIEVAA